MHISHIPTFLTAIFTLFMMYLTMSSIRIKEYELPIKLISRIDTYNMYQNINNLTIDTYTRNLNEKELYTYIFANSTKFVMPKIKLSLLSFDYCYEFSFIYYDSFAY